MGTQDRPASTIFIGPFSQNVFWLVVVDRRNKTWLRFLRRSVERPETEAIRLGTAGQHDALKRDIARGKSVERVFPHSGIWLNGFSHRGFLDVGSEDQIGHFIQRLKDFRRALAVHEIDADVRGRVLRSVSRHGSTRGWGDPPFWVLCDGVDDTGTKNAIGSNKQDLALRDVCFSSGGHYNLPFQSSRESCTGDLAVSVLPCIESPQSASRSSQEAQRLPTSQ